MSERWLHYFDMHKAQYPTLLSMAIDHWQYFAPFYHRLRARLPKGARVLEVGCGLGHSAAYLAAHGFDVTGIDNEQKLIDEAQKLAREWSLPIAFEVADAFDLSRYHGRFDLVYSAGVLEHWPREQTVALLREQSKCAPDVVLLVPSRYTPCHTDERFYTLPQIAGLIRDAGLREVTRFAFGNVLHNRVHVWLRLLAPDGLYLALQKYGSFAMSLGVWGRRVDE